MPTIVLDGGEGLAMFGPVISAVPGDDKAEELWHHVAWLVRHPEFAELKRDRLSAPTFGSERRSDSARHELALRRAS